MEKKYKKEVCRVCGKPTKQIFNIDFKKAYICWDCESRIVRQSIINIYNSQ